MKHSMLVPESRMKEPLYWWKVRCIDTRTRTFFDRYLVFDPPAGLPKQTVQHAREVLEDGRRKTELIGLRPMFKEVEEEQLDRMMRCSQGSSSVSPSHDYFEDESGTALDEIDVMSIRTGGQQDPIILGNVKSVLRLPHASLRNAGEWTLEKSNDVTHLLQLIGVLQQTAWYRGKLSIKSQGEDVSLDCAPFHHTLSIFPLLRQLLFQRRERHDPLDDVFRVAVDHYANHCSDQAKVAWILHEKESFEEFLLGENRLNFGCDLDGMSNGEVLDTLIYGTGILHRRSRKNREEQLARLQLKNNRQKLAFTLHGLCRQLIGSTTGAAILIQRDFARWVGDGACPRPTRVVMESVLDPRRFSEGS